MQRLYERSSWGWKERGKLNELRSKLAYYLIAKNHENKIVGFCHFRFLMDNNRPVLYIYEIQICSQFRSLGLGTRMLNLLILISQKSSMSHVMATVFTFNEMSLKFFKKHGFVKDFTSPSSASSADYVILNKDIGDSN